MLKYVELRKTIWIEVLGAELRVKGSIVVRVRRSI
jgi:hypothetical protein